MIPSKRTKKGILDKLKKVSLLSLDLIRSGSSFIRCDLAASSIVRYVIDTNIPLNVNVLTIKDEGNVTLEKNQIL